MKILVKQSEVHQHSFKFNFIGSAQKQIDETYEERIVIINYLVIFVLFLLAVLIYLIHNWEDKKWKKIITCSLLVLYALYYILYCWIIIDSQQSFPKNYLIQTYFISINLWNHLYYIKYKYIILFTLQLVLVSISLAISNIYDELWNNALVTSAFLFTLFSIEFNGMLKQNIMNQSLQYFQQEFKGIQDKKLANNQRSDKKTEDQISSQKQFQYIQQSQNKFLNCQEGNQQIQQKLDTVPQNINSKGLNSPSFLSKLQSHNNLNTHNQITKENINIYTNQFSPNCHNYQLSNAFDLGTNFSSKENILKAQFNDQNINSFPINSNDQEDRIIKKNLSNFNQMQNIDREISICINKLQQKSQINEDNNFFQNSKRVSFSDFPLNYRGKSELNETNNTPKSSQNRRDTINRQRVNSDSAESVKINNIILQRIQSQEQSRQYSTQKNITFQDNITTPNKNTNEQIDPLTVGQIQQPIKSTRLPQQFYNRQSMSGIAQYHSKPIKSLINYNQQGNDTTKINQEKQIDQNIQDPETSLYKQQNETNNQCLIYPKGQQAIQNGQQKDLTENNYEKKERGSLRQAKSDEFNNQQEDEFQQFENNINFKIKLNSQQEQRSSFFGKGQVQQTVSSRSSILSNANHNSMSIRLKLHELEKNFTPSNDQNLVNNNQILKIQKCSYCNQSVSPSKPVLNSYAYIYQEENNQNKRNSIQVQEKRCSILVKEQTEEDYRRNLYEKMVYDTIECGILILNQNISIIHKNKQIHEFFHQSEVNENLMSFLKLITISDQSIVSLKQILLSSNKQERYRNINDKKEVKMQTMWGLTQINSFLNRLNNQKLKVEPLSLREFIQSLFQIFSQKQLKYQLKDIVIEVFQVLFTQQSSDQMKQSDVYLNSLYMAVQLKIYFSYRAEIDQYECLLSLVNTRSHDIAIKKEISESLSHRIFQTLSHEFGTYMNIISNITENALEDDRISVELKKDYFRIINTNSILLENVIKDMRDFFSIMNSKLEVKCSLINLKETLFQTLELFKKQFQLKKLKTSIKIQKGILTDINSDGQLIKQILSNFISNSLKFTLKGQIKVFLFKHSERYLRLEVEDSGIGMSSEECERLKGMLKNGFSDEKISKNSVGLGFGLLISNNLARLIGNPQKKQAIYFQSRPQEGSKFWILINVSIGQNNKLHNDNNQVKKRSIFNKEFSENSNKLSLITGLLVTSKESEKYQNPLISKKDLKRSKSNSLQSQTAETSTRVKNKSETKKLDRNTKNNLGDNTIPTQSSEEKVGTKITKQMKYDRQNSKNNKINPLITDLSKSNSRLKQNLTVITNKIQDKYMDFGEIINESINSNLDINIPTITKRRSTQKKQYAISQKILDYSSQSIHLQSNNDRSLYIQKLIHNTSEKHIKNDKRNSETLQVQSQNSYSSPLKSSNGAYIRKQSSQTPRISLESSQMINSKIIQIKKRARHTITNKYSSNQIQIQGNNQGINDTPNNPSENSIDDNTNKTYSHISKIPISTFETPNYVTMQTKNGRTTQTPKSIILGQHYVQGNNVFSIASCSPLKLPNKSKETLLFYGFNQHNPFTGLNQNIQTLHSIKNNDTEQGNCLQHNCIHEQEQQNNLEKNSNVNNNHLTKKLSQIISNNDIAQNQISNNQLNQKIIEDLDEDDTRFNQSICSQSDNYSSCMNENCYSNPQLQKQSISYVQVKPDERKGSQFGQADKIYQSNNSSNRNSKNLENNLTRLSRSNSTKRNNDDDGSESSLLMSTNNSISIEYIAQRDLIEYSDYEFDENVSLDDLDYPNNQYKIVNNSQSQSQFSPLNMAKKIPGAGIKRKPTKIEKIFEECNSLSGKSLSDLKTNQYTQIKIPKGYKLEENIQDQSILENSDQNEDYYNRESIPSERLIQNGKYLQDVEVSKKFIQKDQLEKKCLINIIKVQNSDSISNDKNIEFPQLSPSVGNEIAQSTSICVQRVPSISLKLKKQKQNPNPSTIEQNLFSFGGDDRIFFVENQNQQTIQKAPSIKVDDGLINQNKLISLKNGNFLQNPSQQQFKQSSSQQKQMSDQEQHEQNQYKITCLDENNLEIAQKQNKQLSLTNLRSYSMQTISMINVDEHESNSPMKVNTNRLIDNTQLQNIQGQKKILLVDDEIFNIYSLKLIFSKFGLKDHILEAYNGQQAIEIIMNQQNLKSRRNNEQGNQIGLIIMDVNMPIMNGIECTQFIRKLENDQELHYSPNIIGYTAYSDSQTRNQCYEAGMDDLLLKPSRRDDFIYILEKYYLNY